MMNYVQLSLFDVNPYECLVTTTHYPSVQVGELASKIKYEQLVLDLFPKQTSKKSVSTFMRDAA